MKTLLAILVLLSTTIGLFAQNLSEQMSAFADYCIDVRNAAAQKDADLLADCIVKWRPAQYNDSGELSKKELLVYKSVLIDYSELKSNPIDNSGEINIDNHLKFMPQSIDDLITNQLESMNLNAAHQLRSKANFDFLQHDASEFMGSLFGFEIPSEKIEYVVKALKSNSKTVFSFAANGNIEMFAVSEKNGAINLTARTSDNRAYEDALPWGKDSAQLIFYCNCGDITVTIENCSSNPTSVIFATHQK